MRDALHDLWQRYDGEPPRHEYLAARYGQHTPEPGDDDADANEARAHQEMDAARICARRLVDMQRDFPRPTLVELECMDAARRDIRRHLENHLSYRRIAWSIRRRQARAA